MRLLNVKCKSLDCNNSQSPQLARQWLRTGRISCNGCFPAVRTLPTVSYVASADGQLVASPQITQLLVLLRMQVHKLAPNFLETRSTEASKHAYSSARVLQVGQPLFACTDFQLLQRHHAHSSRALAVLAGTYLVTNTRRTHEPRNFSTRAVPL